MEEKKLNDEEIIKALEHCATESTCRGCIKYNKEPTIDYFKCMRDTKNNVVDLFHRLQSENETLKSDLKKELDEHDEHEEFTKNAKAEIERLMSEMDQRREMMHRMDCNYATQLKKIDELQKQVDELDKFNTELQKENSKLVGATNLDGYLLKAVEQQAIKDTAKEILGEFYLWIGQDFDDIPEDGFIHIMKKDFKRRMNGFYQRYGIEVE